MYVAFVACNRNAERFREDPSFIYRCQNLAAALEAQGHRTALLHLRQFPFSPAFDVAIFHRPQRSWRLRFALGQAKRCGTMVLADLDDLIFDPDLAGFSPGVLNGLIPLAATRKTFLAHRRALTLFEGVTVATAPLAEHLRSLSPAARVAVLPNGVHHSWLSLPPKNTRPPAEPVITYFPGTPSHDRDFAAIAAPLTEFLRRHSEARLRIAGPLRFEIGARPGQIIHREKVPFDSFASLFQGAWVNLAPLEPTPFTRCKSALKVLEAGFWNVPTICSPSPDAARFEGAGAFAAAEPDAWLERLEYFRDPDRYRQATTGLRQRVLERAAVTAHATQLTRFASEGGLKAR